MKWSYQFLIIASAVLLTTLNAGSARAQNDTFYGSLTGDSITTGTNDSGFGAGAVDFDVSSTGKLGIAMSSARYKHDIHDMGAASSGLMKLRPVTFRYTDDPAGGLQYGLIAEEVAQVYPELVSHGPDGEVQSVHYLTLIPMLLNELQKQDRQLNAAVTRMSRDSINRSRDRQAGSGQRARFARDGRVRASRFEAGSGTSRNRKSHDGSCLRSLNRAALKP
jgi:Chaperone of endosialidase